ncbi:flagellar FLiS export co-chaperone [Campylobacter troglodytis]|uniref:flagellar FLiS export co-chaperone n=1 Tax=Campylobacter troglodytis TaxID=654363 RepID=UPI00115BBE13|nr:flagellar FLiS export co-chaperone [Campylobacter troglodytis]TQR61448.1 hypothetical protein DMC01_01445 [Campylobacter troglodytis]
MNELEILKKHLGEVEGKSKFKAKELSSQINDANDFIAALQLLDLSLKKVQQNIEARSALSLEDAEEKRSLDASNSSIIENCSFMGEGLFNTKLNTTVAGQCFKYEIQNPLLLLERTGYEGVLAYIEDKREELSSLLDQLGEAIALGDLAIFSSNTVARSFKDLLT